MQDLVEVIDPEEQEQSIARSCMVRAGKGRMPMRAPSMQAKQDSPVRVEDLPEVIMGGTRDRLAKQ
jgi:hypothetical protein